MSELRAELKIETPITKSTDKSSFGYAYSSAECIPAGKGQVYVTATDKRQLAVIVCEGTTDARRLIPAGVLPTRKPTARKPCKLSLNGQWESSDGRYAQDDVEGRFPKAEAVFAEFDKSSAVSITLDVKLLSALAGSLGDDRVQILAQVAPGQAVESALAVLPAFEDNHSDNFGLIMPLCTGDPKDAVQGAVETFNGRVSAYRTAQESCPRD